LYREVVTRFVVACLVAAAAAVSAAPAALADPADLVPNPELPSGFDPSNEPVT
jgi:hypothetical protein